MIFLESITFPLFYPVPHTKADLIWTKAVQMYDTIPKLVHCASIKYHLHLMSWISALLVISLQLQPVCSHASNCIFKEC